MASPYETSDGRRVPRRRLDTFQQGDLREEVRMEGSRSRDRSEKVEESMIVYVDFQMNKFVLPYEVAKTWSGIEKLIQQAALRYAGGINNAKDEIEAGEFDLLSARGDILLPDVWEHVVKPGDAVLMSLWKSPVKEDDLRVFKRKEGPKRNVTFDERNPDVVVFERGRSQSESFRPLSPEDPESLSRQSSFEQEEESEESEESDTSTESENEDSEVETETPSLFVERHSIPARDREGNLISFYVDTSWIARHESGNKEVRDEGNAAKSGTVKNGINVEPPLKILRSHLARVENKMTVQLHTWPGPQNFFTDSSVNIRWHHLHGERLDFEQFKSTALTIPGLSPRLQKLTKELLEKVEKEKMRTFVEGMFIEPGTVLRAEEKQSEKPRKDSQAAIFSCIPYFELQTPSKSGSNNSARLHPPRSLMQSYYPYEPVGDRDREQAIRTLDDTRLSSKSETKKILYVPLMWMLSIGSHAIVTCGHTALSDSLVKSITIVPESIKPSVNRNSTSKEMEKAGTPVIRLTDWDGRTLLYSVDECQTYFEIEQKLRELRFTLQKSTIPNIDNLELLWKSEKGEKVVGPQDWPEIIQRPDLLFVELSVLDDGHIREQKAKEKEDISIKSDLKTYTRRPMDTFPPFFRWPRFDARDTRQGSPVLHTKSPDSPEGLKKKFKEKFDQASGNLSQEQLQSLKSLQVMEKSLTSETLASASHVVEQAFTSAKHYEEIPEETHEHLLERFPFLGMSEKELNDHQKQSSQYTPKVARRTMHQAICEKQIARFQPLLAEFAWLVEWILRHFVWDVNEISSLRKVWGSIGNIVKYLQCEQRHGPCPYDEKEYSDPSWRSPLSGERKWYIRSERNTFRKGKWSFDLLSDEEAPLKETTKRCKDCRHTKSYNSPEAAIEHLKKHIQDLSESGTNINEKDVDLKDWIRNDQQLATEELNGAFICLLSYSIKLARCLLSQTDQLTKGVRTPEGFSDKYTFPLELLKSLRRIINFSFAVERSMYFATKLIETPLKISNEEENPFSVSGFEVLERFYESAKLSLQSARRQLCTMGRSNDSEDYTLRMDLGPEYILGWLMRRLIVKPIRGGMAVADLYRDYLSTLQFEVNHRPSKRHLRSINLLSEELSALDLMNKHQSNLLYSYSRVLDPTTYACDRPTRSAMFIHEHELIRNTQDNLNDTHQDFTETLSRCPPLSESTKQSAEINEEDHGKAILVFTVVTIIFLPLSFVTSYLGMNTSDIRDMPNSQALFWQIAVPVTILTLGSVTLIAYNGDEIRDQFTYYGKLLAGKKPHKKSTTTARSIGVAQRKRLNTVLDSSTTLGTASTLADDAEFAIPYTNPVPMAPPSQRWDQLRVSDNRPTREYAWVRGRSKAADYNVAADYSVDAPAPVSTRMGGNHPNSRVFIDNPVRQDAPTYVKIHRKYLDPETLSYYDIPWEYDYKDPNYYILLRDMDTRETDILFEHTRRLRGKAPARSTYDDYYGDEKKEYNWVKKSKRRSRETSPETYREVYDDRTRGRGSRRRSPVRVDVKEMFF